MPEARIADRLDRDHRLLSDRRPPRQADYEERGEATSPRNLETAVARHDVQSPTTVGARVPRFSDRGDRAVLARPCAFAAGVESGLPLRFTNWPGNVPRQASKLKSPRSRHSAPNSVQWRVHSPAASQTRPSEPLRLPFLALEHRSDSLHCQHAEAWGGEIRTTEAKADPASSSTNMSCLKAILPGGGNVSLGGDESHVSRTQFELTIFTNRAPLWLP